MILIMHVGKVNKLNVHNYYTHYLWVCNRYCKLNMQALAVPFGGAELSPSLRNPAQLWVLCMKIHNTGSLKPVFIK